MELDAPESQDITKIMADIQALWWAGSDELRGAGQVLVPADWGESHSGHLLDHWDRSSLDDLLELNPWKSTWTQWETWRPAWITAWGRARPTTRCSWSSSVGSCCTWSQRCLRPGQGAAPDPGAQSLAEYQGQAGGWDHHLPSPAGRQGGFQSWCHPGQQQRLANCLEDHHPQDYGCQSGVWDQWHQSSRHWGSQIEAGCPLESRRPVKRGKKWIWVRSLHRIGHGLEKLQKHLF